MVLVGAEPEAIPLSACYLCNNLVTVDTTAKKNLLCSILTMNVVLGK